MTSTNEHENGSAVVTVDQAKKAKKSTTTELQEIQKRRDAESGSKNPLRRRQVTMNLPPKVLADIVLMAEKTGRSFSDVISLLVIDQGKTWFDANKPTAAQLTLLAMDEEGGEVHDVWRDLPPSTLEAE